MDADRVLSMLAAGSISARQAKKMLALYHIERVSGIARIDSGRQARRGIPEVVLAESKTPDDTKRIAAAAVRKSGSVLVSRAGPAAMKVLALHAKRSGLRADYGKNSTSVLLYRGALPGPSGTVGIIAAGTSDIGVAEEARLVCAASGCRTICRYDVGVAGMHRLAPVIREMAARDAGAIVAVAGMEGALPTIVSSLVDIPVIGVPSSVGYGYGRKGVAALAAMLQSCSLGLVTVNIDNGIGAGAAAAGIARRSQRPRERRAARK